MLIFIQFVVFLSPVFPTNTQKTVSNEKVFIKANIDFSLLFWDWDAALRSKVNGHIWFHSACVCDCLRAVTAVCSCFHCTRHTMSLLSAIDSHVRETSGADSGARTRKTELFRGWPAFSTPSTNTNRLNTTLTPAGLEHMIRINRSTGVNIAKCHSSQQDLQLLVEGRRVPSLEPRILCCLYWHNKVLCN